MKWNEVRRKYPNKFVLLMSLNEHIENNKKYIEGVTVIFQSINKLFGAST